MADASTDSWDPTQYDFDPRPSDFTEEERQERIAVIRTSDRIMFRRCRRRWGWNSHLRGNIGPKQNPAPLWMGTGFHFALEDCHGINKYGHPATAFEAYVEATKRSARRDPNRLPADIVELTDLATGMLRYYWDEWLIARDKLVTYVHAGIPQTEVNFRVEVPWEAGKYGYDKVVYSGTLDRVVIDEHGQLWIVEYKTAKTIQTLHYSNDSQISTYCVPLDTEILTRSGWKKYSELTVGDDVLGYDIDSDSLQWTQLLAVNLPGKQALQRIKGKSLEFVCTPEHEWVKETRLLGTAYRGRKVTQIRKGPITRDQGNSRLILSAPYAGGQSTLTPDEAAVLGWILTDGSHTRADCIEIAQKKYANEVQQLLDTFPGAVTRVTEHKGTKRWHLSCLFTDSLWRRARMSHTLEGWENFLFGMTKEALQAFCAAAMLGDGNVSGQFFQNQGTKHELFKLAFFLLGKFPTKSRGDSRHNKWSDKTDRNTFTIKDRHCYTRVLQIADAGEEEVWCPTTALGTWIMRQDGQIAITGNCWAGNLLYGRPVAGVIYQQHRKALPAEPRVLANGRLSQDKRQLITHRSLRRYIKNLYGEVTNAPQDYVDFLNWLATQEDMDSDKFIRRDKIRRNDHQREAEGVKILMEIEEMLNPDLALYPNPDRTCQYMCPFNGACVSLDDGGDWEYELEILMQQRDKEYDTWRKFLE